MKSLDKSFLAKKWRPVIPSPPSAGEKSTNLLIPRRVRQNDADALGITPQKTWRPVIPNPPSAGEKSTNLLIPRRVRQNDADALGITPQKTRR